VTGACIETGLAGVGVFETDPLKLNIAFKDGQEIAIVPHHAQDIADIIVTYHRDYDRLRELCSRGQEAFRKVFDLDRQLRPRVRLLSEFIRAPNRQADRAATPSGVEFEPARRAR